MTSLEVLSNRMCVGLLIRTRRSKLCLYPRLFLRPHRCLSHLARHWPAVRRDLPLRRSSRGHVSTAACLTRTGSFGLRPCLKVSGFSPCSGTWRHDMRRPARRSAVNRCLTPSLFLGSEFRVRLLPSLHAPGQANASHQGNNDGQDRGFCPVDGAMAGVCEEDLNDEDQGDAAGPDERGNLPRVLSCPSLHALRMAWRRYRRDPPFAKIRTERPAWSVASADSLCWSARVRQYPGSLVKAVGVTVGWPLRPELSARPRCWPTRPAHSADGGCSGWDLTSTKLRLVPFPPSCQLPGPCAASALFLNSLGCAFTHQ
jgi:hypothetical protein